MCMQLCLPLRQLNSQRVHPVRRGPPAQLAERPRQQAQVPHGARGEATRRVPANARTSASHPPTHMADVQTHLRWHCAATPTSIVGDIACARACVCACACVHPPAQHQKEFGCRPELPRSAGVYKQDDLLTLVLIQLTRHLHERRHLPKSYFHRRSHAQAPHAVSASTAGL